ncbi:MAG: DUF4230 domain-containing protein [Muribaculaceae bacterium]|nr:DUF4230 domain-containing protein [Muribaculaceae bacterium]
MMNIAKTIKWTVLLLVVVGIGAAAIWFTRPAEETPVATMEEAKIIDVRPMVKLCSVEVYEDVPVKGSIGSRHIFARASLRGSITFDLEKIRQQWSGDTLVVVLPPEIIDIYESTEPGSYKVIDTWNDKFLRSSNFTTDEENRIKRLAVDQWRKSIYKRGYVRRARKEAISNLGNMLAPFAAGKEVRIVDPSPEGYPDGVPESSTSPSGTAADSATSITY